MDYRDSPTSIWRLLGPTRVASEINLIGQDGLLAWFRNTQLPMFFIVNRYTSLFPFICLFYKATQHDSTASRLLSEVNHPMGVSSRSVRGLFVLEFSVWIFFNLSNSIWGSLSWIFTLYSNGGRISLSYGYRRHVYLVRCCQTNTTYQQIEIFYLLFLSHVRNALTTVSLEI